MRWTEEEDQALRQLVEHGVALRAMRKVLRSRTEEAIVKRIRKLGLELQREVPVVDWDALKELTA